ncbi:MAG TPA: 2-(1,2-epoxy-1,2-dihydrophenyl)acetyl-CoA isomerase [Actinobacteria bacterium]|nr:2-(1,2-epoxy-1,2-dihydrophenyl)acetyl-CoA isomerase [Actinomycetota bacterium]
MTIRTEIEDDLLVVTLDKPRRRNALDRTMVVELRRVVEAAPRRGVVGLVLEGAGGVFCAGQDLNERVVPAGAPMPDLGESLGDRYNPLIRAIRTCPLPIVAAVRGFAAGAGAGLALACDLVVAATDARFVLSFAKVGLMPDSGASWTVPAAVGRARALGMALLAAPVDASTALRWGLVWAVAPPEEVGVAAREAARRLGTMTPPEPEEPSWI